MDNYAASKLITAMGMFIHDLWAMKCDTECVYSEDAYLELANAVMDGFTVKFSIEPPREGED